MKQMSHGRGQVLGSGVRDAVMKMAMSLRIVEVRNWSQGFEEGGREGGKVHLFLISSKKKNDPFIILRQLN
jgi:hypothetical protein